MRDKRDRTRLAVEAPERTSPPKIGGTDDDPTLGGPPPVRYEFRSTSRPRIARGDEVPGESPPPALPPDDAE
jgi:hypothetical protein